jgi:hypothetical protein
MCRSCPGERPFHPTTRAHRKSRTKRELRVIRARGADTGPGAGADCPTGKSAPPPPNPLSSPSAENIPLAGLLETALGIPPSDPTEGRIAIVTDAGLDAVDAAASGEQVNCRAGFGLSQTRERSNGALTNGVVAYGKTVWSRHPLLVPSCRWRNRSNRVDQPSSRQRR